jgi:hypothetical protein
LVGRVGPTKDPTIFSFFLFSFLEYAGLKWVQLILAFAGECQQLQDVN